MSRGVSRPRVLTLCHCLPQKDGTRPQRRAWELLSAAAETCEVWLLTAMSQPVNLRHWRELRGHTAELVLVRGSITVPQARRIRQTLADWADRSTFDAVLCTHPRLWWAAELIDAPARLCDTAEVPELIAARWRLWLDRLALRRTTAATATNVLLTTHADAAGGSWRRRHPVPEAAPAALHGVLARLNVTWDDDVRRAA